MKDSADLLSAAKLERHNNVLSSRWLTTASTWRAALREGYLAQAAPEFRYAVRLENVRELLDLVIVHR